MMLKSYLKIWVKQIINSKITLKIPSVHHLFVKKTEPGEVKKYLNNPDMKKANDNCGISPRLIKIGASKLKSHTAFLFNQCLTHGIFADKL